MFIALNGKTEEDEGDADADEAEVVAVSAVLLPRTSGTGDLTLTNTGEKDAAAAVVVVVVVVVAAAATTGNTTGVDRLLAEIVSKEGEGDAGGMGQTPTTVTDDPLLIMALTHSLHLRRPPTRRTQHHLKLLRHRTHNLLRPLPCMGLLL